MPRLEISRPISEQEAAVVTRVLERCALGEPTKINRSSISKLKVVSRCACGCDTVDFESVDWSKPPSVVAEGTGKTENGDEVGIIVFADGGTVVCLEVYNHGSNPALLPLLDSVSSNGPPQSAF